MDLKAIGADLGLEEDEFLEIVELFLETAGEDINRLKQAVGNGDLKTIAEASHSLKGSSGNLGFLDIYALSKEIENHARDNAMDALSTAIKSIELIKDDIQIALNAGSA